MIKKLFVFFLGIGMMVPLLAQAQVTTQGGGTGSTSPSGILIGITGNLRLSTLTIGSNLTLSGTTLSAGGGSTASSTLYGDSGTFSGFNRFLNQTVFGGIFATNASTTNATTTNLAITGAAVNCGGTNALTTSSTGVVGCTAQPQGTVTSIAVATANGFAGSSSGGATPSLTLTTTITGLLKGNGTAISAATPGTDYDTFAWPFTPTSYGNATGTLTGFTGGILSVGSTTIVGNATTTGMHAFGSVRIPTLGVSSGTFIAVDPNGVIIATTTPQGSSGAFSPSANYGTVAGLPSYTATGGIITEVGTGALSVDGSSPAVGNIVLVKNESGACTSSAGTCQNGLYNVTAAGSGIAAFVLTRNANYNSSSNVIPGIVTYIISGATLADDFWALTTPAPITVGTTGLTYVEVSGGGAAVTSVANSDASLTISPTAGAVVASLNVSHFNAWTTQQTFTSLFATLASTTNATTTNLTVTASTTLGSILNGAGLSTCTGTSFEQWSAGAFSCAAAPGVFPFTPNAASIFFGTVSNSTTTQIHFAGSPFSLTASSTAVFNNASTSLATISTGLYLGANAEITSFTGTGLTVSGGALGLSIPVTVANGGTGATSLTGSQVTYTNSAGTALLTVATSTTGTANAILALSNIGATAITYASTTELTSGTNTFFVNSSGGITAKDVATAYTGILSPVSAISLQTGTTTGWTASTSNPYIPTGVAPFAGTLKDIKCATDASFLGIEVDINGSAASPTYFVASTTKGLITFTGSNTFSYGDVISLKAGTTTTATATTVSCTIRTVQTT